MSTFNTRCPSCSGVNRVPTERISESPKCGKCQAALLDGAPIEGTELNLDAILQSDQPVVIDFWAPWCNPCVGFAPVFSDVAEERSQIVRFVKVDTESQQNIAAKYQIRSIPTVMVFKNGKRVDVINGALPKGQFNQW
ncbi:thioredoxin, partial [Vibrio xuii]